RGDELARFHVGDLELSRQGVRALTVDRGEVDRLRPRAHVRRHVSDRNTEDDRGRLPVNVTTRLERVDERWIGGEVCEQAQLDLRVVSREKQPSLSWDEATANVAAKFSANRNVLKVRIARREPPRGRDGLVERGVKPLVI